MQKRMNADTVAVLRHLEMPVKRQKQLQDM